MNDLFQKFENTFKKKPHVDNKILTYNIRFD